METWYSCMHTPHEPMSAPPLAVLERGASRTDVSSSVTIPSSILLSDASVSPGIGVDVPLLQEDLSEPEFPAQASEPSAMLYTMPAKDQIQLPLKLGVPVLDTRTNPYVDLATHLRRHGMNAEAREFARSQVTCEFVLHAFLTMHKPSTTPSEDTAERASKAGEDVARALEQCFQLSLPSVHEQLRHAAMGMSMPPGHAILPSALRLAWTRTGPYDKTQSVPVLPTHVLALGRHVQSVKDTQGAEHTLAVTPCVLVPVHWIVYVLQCAHMPTAISFNSAQGGTLPVVPMAMPYPKLWSHMHLWLYTRDPSKLLASLLPLASMLHMVHGTSLDGLPFSAIIDVLACQSVSLLLRLALRIRATWHNGRHIGIFADAFWQTLQRGWDLVVGAIIIRKGRTPPPPTNERSARAYGSAAV